MRHPRVSAANCVFLVLKELRRHCLVFLEAFDEVRVEPACPPSHCHFQRTSAVVAVTSRVVPSAPVPREAAAESSFEPEPEPEPETEPETETEPEHEISPLVEIDQPPP